MAKTCTRCGKSISYAPKRLYCNECRVLVRREAIRAWRRRNKERCRVQSKATITRECLCCGQPFPSEGPYNRLCGACKGSEEYLFAEVWG